MAPDIRKFATDPMAFFEFLMAPSAFGNKRFGEVMAEHQRDWFGVVAPSMLSVSRDEKPDVGRFWSERTKGGSKDSDIACVLLWLLAFSKQKLDMQVGAADRDQANELKKAATDILRLNPWLSERVEDQTKNLICRATGSVCAILSTDVAGSHGARPDVVVMNELSHVTKEEFAANLLDNATKKPNGLVIVATNAGFVDTWQESWRKVAMESKRWDFHSFCQPAPWLTEEEVEEARKRNSKSRFNRLFWGVWARGIGDALDEADIEMAIDKNLKPHREPRDKWFYVAGLDLGIKHDHSALVLLAGHRGFQQLQLAHIESWAPDKTGKVDLMKVENAVIRLHQRFRPRFVGYDPWQAELLASRCRHRRVKMKEVAFTGKNLNLMATTLLEVFRSRQIQLYEDRRLTDDLGRLTIEERSYGHRLTATRNASGHADVATAFTIALPPAVEFLTTKPFMGGAGDENTVPDTRTAYQRYVDENRMEAEAEPDPYSILGASEIVTQQITNF